MCAGFTDAPALHPLLSAKQSAAEECPGCEHDRVGFQHRPVCEVESFDPTLVRKPKPRRLTRDDGDAVLGREKFLDRRAIKFSVGLNARPLNCRALRSVEHPVMDCGAVGSARHPPVKRVDFAHQMPLAQPTDRWVARHRPDQRGVETDERDTRTKPCRGRRSLGSSVPTANDDDIENRFILHDCGGL